jgi:predicted porin
MNKKILAVAVAAAFAVPAIAAADTTLYGQVNFEVQSLDGDIDTGSYGSRIGVKGSEDLGGGLKGIWQVEGSITLAESSDANWNRNTFVGLNGGFGTVLGGRYDHPYKIASLPFRNFGDTLVDSTAGSGSKGGNFRAQSFLRSSGVVAYVSPNMSGFQVLAAVVPFTDDNGDGQTPFSLAATYKQGPVYLTVAYEDMEDAGLDYETALIGGTYMIGGLTAGVMYEQKEVQSSNEEIARWLIPVTYDLNNNVTLRAAVQMDDPDAGDDATDFALGAQYKFSKRTETYVNVVTRDDNETTDFGLGVRHKF